VPDQLDLSTSLGFARALRSQPEAKEYIFDFQQLRWLEPFPMLYLSSQLRRFASQHAGCRFGVANFEELGYASHMGFFQAFGLDFGKQPGEAKGNDRYLPITVLAVADLEQEAAASYREIGEVIERRSRRLARMLTQQDCGDLVDTLTYSFREMIRNVVEHSASDSVEYCAQYWPTRQSVEIAILDAGKGLRASLSENPFLQPDNDREALNLCLLPGVSGKMYNGRSSTPYDEWQNSGYGLYVTSRLCGNGGAFFICSGDTGLLLGHSRRQYLKTDFKGTALSLVLRTDRIGALTQSCKRILLEGDRIAKRLSGEQGYLTASVASRMLSRDFE
jgi:anti-sigma regulatory factor (Ser/Thr protein kinase)